MSDPITMVKGVVVDLNPIVIEDSWLVGQIFVSSNPYYFNTELSGAEYIGKTTLIGNKADNYDMWLLFRDHPDLDTWRVPVIPDLSPKDFYFVQVEARSSIIEGGTNE